MPVSGLIVTLSDGSAGCEAVREMLSRPELELGEIKLNWVPVALDARDDTQSREIHDWISGLPGVEFVDVVYVNFESNEAGEEVQNHSLPFSEVKT